MKVALVLMVQSTVFSFYGLRVKALLLKTGVLLLALNTYDLKMVILPPKKVKLTVVLTGEEENGTLACRNK